MRMRHLLCAAGIAVLGATSPAFAETTLVVIHDTNQGMADFYDAIVPEFEAAHPGVKVETKAVGGGVNGIIEKTRIMAAAGGQLDVVEFWAEGAAGLFGDDILLDLGPYFKRDPGFLQDLLPIRVQGYTWNGHLLGVPFNANAYPAYYNADLLAAAGLATPPELGAGWNWATLLEDAKRLTVDKNGDGTTDQWGIRAGANPLRFPMWLKNAGGGLFDRTANPTRSDLTSPASMDGLRFWTSLYLENQVAGNGTLGFKTGKIGFEFDQGPYLMGDLAASKTPFKWGVANRPMGPANNGTILLGTGYIIPKTTAHPDLAWDFVKFVAGRSEGVRKMYQITGRTPAYRPALAEYSTFVQDQYGPGAAPMMDITVNPANFSGWTTPKAAEINSAISPAVNGIISGKKPLVATIQALNQQLNGILSE